MYQGKEITAVYEEIMKTLPIDHLKFSNVSWGYVGGLITKPVYL